MTKIIFAVAAVLLASSAMLASAISAPNSAQPTFGQHYVASVAATEGRF